MNHVHSAIFNMFRTFASPTPSFMGDNMLNTEIGGWMSIPNLILQ